MSIRDEINARIMEGRLFELPPYLQDMSAVRGIFMSESVKKLVLGPWLTTAHEERGGELRADFDEFISGEQIIVCLEPFKAGIAHMGILDPVTDGVWDYRSRDPSPALRVFGHFAEKDIFLALNWEYRRNLKGRGSRRWKKECAICKSAWRNLFPSHKPVNGDNIHDYFQSDVIKVSDIG